MYKYKDLLTYEVTPKSLEQLKKEGWLITQHTLVHSKDPSNNCSLEQYKEFIKHAPFKVAHQFNGLNYRMSIYNNKNFYIDQNQHALFNVECATDLSVFEELIKRYLEKINYSESERKINFQSWIKSTFSYDTIKELNDVYKASIISKE
jgi:hypothetical protein